MKQSPMTLTKLALVLGLAFVSTACVDEIDEATPESQPPDDDVPNADPDVVSEPDLSDLSIPRTCGRDERVADGHCLPK